MCLAPLGERLGEGVVAGEEYDADKARGLRRDGSRGRAEGLGVFFGTAASAGRSSDGSIRLVPTSDFACISRDRAGGRCLSPSPSLSPTGEGDMRGRGPSV